MFTHLHNHKPRIALLGVYLALYDTAFENYYPMMLDYCRRIAARMAEGAEVILVDALSDANRVATFLEEAGEKNVEATVLLSCGYTNSLSVIEPVIASPQPLVLFNTQDVRAVTREFNFDDMVKNHGMQGIQDLASVLVRRGRRFDIVTGLIEDPQTQRELLDRVTAARAYAQTRELKIGYFDPPMQGMGDAQVDTDHLRRVFGIETLQLHYDELAQCARQAADQQVAQTMQFDRMHFDLAPDLTEADHERSVRLEHGLRAMVEKYQLAGLTLSFDCCARSCTETIPFLGLCKLLGDGVAYAGEGDLLNTACVAMGGRLCDQTNFTEMYTMDFDANATFHTHMAECNWRMARRDCKPRLLRRQFTLAECQPFAAPVFSLEPGPVTLYDLTLNGQGQFRLITLQAQVDDFPALAGFEIPNFRVSYRRDVRDIVSDYSRLGGTHHMGMAYGHLARRFEHFAALAGLDYAAIENA